MKRIATVLGCAALLSCSTDADGPRSPLLSEVVRAPGIVWSTDTLDCRQIAREDVRLDALSQANEIERHRLVRARNIQLVQWLIPYYGWVATARAGVLDDEVKHVDIVIEDAADRRQELKQFALAENCGGAAAKISDAPAVASAIADPTASLAQPAALPAIRHEDPPPRVARPTGGSSPVAPAPAPTKSETGTRVEGGGVILPVGPGTDVDRAAADITAALRQR